MNAGTAIAIVLGLLAFRWPASHEGLTLALVKLEAGNRLRVVRSQSAFISPA